MLLVNHLRKRLVSVVTIGVSTVTVFLLGWNLWSTRVSQASVQIADSKQMVESKLGKPAAIFTNDFVALKYGGEVWAYGRHFDLKALLHGRFPFVIRVFAPDPADNLVVFDANGRVQKDLASVRQRR